MKKFLLSIFAVMLAVFSVNAAEYSYTFTKSQFSANGKKTLNNVEWTLSGNGGYWGYDGTKGQQFGSGSKPYKSLTLSTSGIEGTITKIVINTSGGSKVNATLTVSVGGATFGTKKTLTASAVDYTFTGSASGEIKFSYSQTSSKALYIKSISIISEVEGQKKTVETPVISPESCYFNEGESLFVKIETETKDAEIYYTLNGSDPVENGVPYEGEIELTETTTVKAVAKLDGWNDSEMVEATYTMLAEGEYVDKLTRETTGIASGSSTYKDWSGKTVSSNAIYAGQSAGSNNAIQLRSATDKGYSGIVATNTGGKLKRVVVEWNANTSNGRVLDVYGKKTAYAEVKDLYAQNTAGTKLGSIKCGISTELVIEGDYEYIGLRSADGAMYLNSVEITWVAEEKESYTLSVTDAGYATLFLDFAAAIPAGVEAYAVTAVNTGYVTLTQVAGVLPANTGVIVKADEGDYNFVASTETPATVTVNLLQGTVAATEINVEAYVLWNVDGEACFCKAKMTDGVWLNNANKAYLPASAANGAASYSFRFGEGTTGISEVKGESGEVTTIYDLTGRKLKGENGNLKGIYIINGKKVLVK